MTLVCHHNSPLHSVDVLQVVSNSLKCCHHYLHSPEPRLVQSSVLGVLVVAEVTETTRYQPIRLILCCDNQSEISFIVLYCVNQSDFSMISSQPIRHEYLPEDSPLVQLLLPVCHHRPGTNNQRGSHSHLSRDQPIRREYY